MSDWITPLEQRRLLSAVLLSEIEANPPGTQDNRYEYVEIAGQPGASLTNDYFVAFDGSSGTTGTADLVVNLTGSVLGSSGLLVIQNSASAGHPVPAGTTLFSDLSFFTQTGGFANGTLSFYLFNSSSPFVAGTDYDTNDDGVLDHLPTGATVLDNVAIPDTNNKSDIVYGGVTVAEETSLNKGTADAVTRFPGNTSTTSAAWFGGELVDTNSMPSQTMYDATREAANEPTGAVLTPGAYNFPRVTPTVTITSGDTIYNQSPYIPAASVTGSTGTDGSASVVYTFFNGSAATGAALVSPPTNAGTYTVVGAFSGDSQYAAATSPAKTFTINPTSILPAWVSAGSAGNATWGGQTLSVTGPVSLVANPGGVEPAIVLSGTLAGLNFTSISSEYDLGGLTLTNGATASVQADGATIVIGMAGQNTAPIFNIDSQSSLDLRDNTLIVHGGNLAAIQNDLTENATLYSSVATASSPDLTTLGCILNSNGTGPLYSTLDGVTLSATDVLVKYTYFGDADLSGTVDGSDYSRLDSGFLIHSTGWIDGDFNYDGLINGSDYTLIDNAFNNQSGSFSEVDAQLKTNRRVQPVQRSNTAVPVFTTTGVAADAGYDWLKADGLAKSLFSGISLQV